MNTPWALFHDHPDPETGKSLGRIRSVDSTDPLWSYLPIADIPLCDMPDQKAKAEFIIRACNTHDALVKALAEVMRPYGMYDIAVTKSEGAMTDDLLTIGERIRAALAALAAAEVQP